MLQLIQGLKRIKFFFFFQNSSEKERDVIISMRRSPKILLIFLSLFAFIL